MADKEMMRCRHCIYLAEGNNGEWICADWQCEIHEVEDEDCTVEREAWTWQ